jgi:chromosome segregation ATPase
MAARMDAMDAREKSSESRVGKLENQREVVRSEMIDISASIARFETLAGSLDLDANTFRAEIEKLIKQKNKAIREEMETWLIEVETKITGQLTEYRDMHNHELDQLSIKTVDYNKDVETRIESLSNRITEQERDNANVITDLQNSSVDMQQTVTELQIANGETDELMKEYGEIATYCEEYLKEIKAIASHLQSDHCKIEGEMHRVIEHVNECAERTEKVEKICADVSSRPQLEGDVSDREKLLQQVEALKVKLETLDFDSVSDLQSFQNTYNKELQYCRDAIKESRESIKDDVRKQVETELVEFEKTMVPVKDDITNVAKLQTIMQEELSLMRKDFKNNNRSQLEPMIANAPATHKSQGSFHGSQTPGTPVPREGQVIRMSTTGESLVGTFRPATMYVRQPSAMRSRISMASPTPPTRWPGNPNPTI